MASILVESSFISSPVTLLYLWQLQKHLGAVWALWLSVVAGIVLDILNVKTIGISSLLFVSYWVGQWVLQRFFSRFQAIEILWLTVLACIWSLWEGGNWWSGLLIGIIALVINNFRGTNLHRSEYLRRV